MRSKSVLLLVSAVLGVVYAVYVVAYFSTVNAGSASGAEAVGAGIATLLVVPHLLCTVLAALFNVLGWACNRRAFALTAGILYAAAIVCMPLYAPFTIVQSIMCFVAYARMRKPID